MFGVTESFSTEPNHQFKISVLNENMISKVQPQIHDDLEEGDIRDDTLLIEQNIKIKAVLLIK